MRPYLALFLSLSAPTVTAQDHAPFDAATVFAGEQERFVKTADLDGDGRVEAVGWWQINSTTETIAIHRLRGYQNDGTGRLLPTWSLEFTSPRFQWTSFFDPHESCEAADLDSDGDDDFVIAAGDHLDVWLSNGALPPTLAISTPTPLDVPWRSVVLADFDLDGDLDLGATRGSLLEIYDLDFVGGALVGRASRLGAVQMGRLLALDCTGDGGPDLVSDGRLIFPIEAGAIGTPIDHPHVWTFDSGFELRHDAGDVDGDGDGDVVTFRKHVSLPTTSYSILRRTGPATFVREGPYSGGPARRLFDVDGDGDLDGVCCGGGGGGVPLNRIASSFRIALNDGTGTFAPALEVLGLGSTAIAGVADLDQDGRMDLVAGRSVWFQRQAIGGAPQPVVASRELLDCARVDVDGDGDIDVEPRAWSVGINRGDALLSVTGVSAPPPPVGARSGEGFWADWDGDGDADYLINIISSGSYLGLELVRNRGNGSYESAGLVVNDASAAGFHVYADDGLAADVDGDGDLDLVRRNVTGSPRRSAWWRNDGATFQFRESWEAVTIHRVADFDGDGVADLLSFVPSSLQISHGLGGGAFLPFALVASVQADNGDNGIDVADLDADGDLDIVVVDRIVGSTNQPRGVRWFDNDGAGAFAPVTLDLGSLHPGIPSSVHLIDVDLDGRLDVVAAPVLEPFYGALVLHARSDGSGFDAPIVQLLLNPPPSSPSGAPQFPRLGAADLDGDGDVDLLTNRMLSNMAHHGDARGIHAQIGAGTPGTGGIRPLLGADGPFRAGEPVRIHLRAAAPGSTGYMNASIVAGIPPPSFDPGGVALVRGQRIVSQSLFTTTGANGGLAGSGTWELPFTVPTYTIGQTRQYVAYVDDAGTTAGFARSNALYVVYGP